MHAWRASVLAYFACSRACCLRVFMCFCACVLVCLRFYLILSFDCVLLIAKIKVWQSKKNLHLYKCMLIDVNLKSEIEKTKNKLHANIRYIVNPLMPRILISFKILQRMILNLIINLESAIFLECMWPYWSIKH